MNLSKEELDLLEAAVLHYEGAYGDWRKSLNWLTNSTSVQLAVERESLQKLARALKEEAGSAYHDLQCENKIVTFLYRSHSGKEATRTVTVHRLEVQSIDNDYYKRGTLLLTGYCHDRKARRSFALKNILTRIKPYMEEPAAVTKEEPAQKSHVNAAIEKSLVLPAIGSLVKCTAKGPNEVFRVQGYYEPPEGLRYLICKPCWDPEQDPMLLRAKVCYKVGADGVATRG